MDILTAIALGIATLREGNMEIKAAIIVTAALLLSACATPPTTPSQQQQQQFIRNTAQQSNLSPTKIKNILSHAKYSPSVIAKMTTPYESKPYDVYRQHFLTDRRIDQGAQFWQEHQDILALAQKKYGVDPSIIIAILGVETHYGEHEGNYRVLDALYTLSFFYPQRAAFFRKELAQYLVLCDQQHLSTYDVQGSYAGALGMPQFMPSSYRAYGVDFAGNHHIDLMRNTDDVVMSVANYLAHSGWQRNQPIAAPLNPSYLARVEPYVNTKAKLVIPVATLEKRGVPLLNYSAAAKPQNVSVLMLNDSTSNEYWLVFANFRSILKYNTSPNYAMAVYQLSEAIQEKYAQHTS